MAAKEQCRVLTIVCGPGGGRAWSVGQSTLQEFYVSPARGCPRDTPLTKHHGVRTFPERWQTILAGTTPAQAGEPVWAVRPAPGHALHGLQQPGAGQGTATAPTPSLLVPPQLSPFWEYLGYCRRLPSLLLAGWGVGPPPSGAATLWPCTRGPSLFPKASSQQALALMVGNGLNFHQFVLGGVEFWMLHFPRALKAAKPVSSCYTASLDITLKVDL